MRDKQNVVSEATVQTPDSGIQRFQVEVIQHMIEAERILSEEYNLNVKLEAELTIDTHGNRAAYFFPMERKIVDRKLLPWTRIEMPQYGSDGIYAAFNGGHRTYEPSQTAYSIKCDLDAIRRRAAEAAAQQEG